MTRAATILNRLGEAIPQEQLKRAEVRKQGQRTTDMKSSHKLGISPQDVIGWFSTSGNAVAGWAIFKASGFDKKEFGEDSFRIYSETTETTTMVKFNLRSGTVSFIDGEHYADTDQVKWKTATPYRQLLIDGNGEAMKAFGVI